MRQRSQFGNEHTNKITNKTKTKKYFTKQNIKVCRHKHIHVYIYKHTIYVLSERQSHNFHNRPCDGHH